MHVDVVPNHVIIMSIFSFALVFLVFGHFFPSPKYFTINDWYFDLPLFYNNKHSIYQLWNFEKQAPNACDIYIYIYKSWILTFIVVTLLFSYFIRHIIDHIIILFLIYFLSLIFPILNVLVLQIHLKMVLTLHIHLI